MKRVITVMVVLFIVVILAGVSNAGALDPGSCLSAPDAKQKDFCERSREALSRYVELHIAAIHNTTEESKQQAIAGLNAWSRVFDESKRYYKRIGERYPMWLVDAIHDQQQAASTKTDTVAALKKMGR